MPYLHTDKYVFSKLTLGTVALGIDYGISNQNGKPGIEESLNILSAALKFGINCFDTARTYGSAEQLIGNFLAGRRENERVHVVSKFKIGPENIMDAKRAGREALESVQASLKYLKLDRLAICLFHMDRNLPEKPVREVIPAIFKDLKARGMIDLAGVSIDHPEEGSWWVDHPLIDVLQIPLNIFDHRLIRGGLLPQLTLAGKIIFVRSVFLQGLFFLSPEELKGNLKKAAGYLKDLRALAGGEAMTAAELAFVYVRDTKGISSIVFGANQSRQIAENINLLKLKQISSETRRSIDRLFADLPEDIITPAQWNSHLK